MDWSLLSNFLPSVEEEPRDHLTYYDPYGCYPQAVGDMQPPGNLGAQAKGSKEIMLQTEEKKSGKTRNRWRSHKKETCQCAVCKQVRGELSSTWFKHDRANCKCSVCRQARGEKRVGKLKAREETKKRTPSISNRVLRLTGRARPTYSSPNPTEPGNLEDSDVSSISQSTNVTSEESSAESSSMIRVVPSSQSDMVGGRVNWTCQESTSGSLRLLEQNVSGIVDDPSTGKFASFRALLDAKHTTSTKSSVELPNFTPSTPSSQLHSDRLVFSWRGGPPFAESKSEISFQSTSQASDTLDFSNLRDLTAASKADHLCFRESSVEYSRMTSVVPSSRSDIAGTRLGGVSVSESRSEISCQLTPEITEAAWKSKLADREGVTESTHSFSGESLVESSSITATFSSSQLDADRTRSNWNGGSSISESNEAFPRISNVQRSEYTSINKSVLLAHASDVPQSSSLGSCTIRTRKRKRNWMCTFDRNTCECYSCTDRNSPSSLSSGSKLRYPECPSTRKRRKLLNSPSNLSSGSKIRFAEFPSTRKRRKLLSLSVHTTKPLQAMLDCVGVISTAYPRASQSFEKLVNLSLRSLSIGQDCVADSHEAPATIGGQHSLSSGSSVNLQIVRPKHDLYQSPTTSGCSYKQMILASPFTSGSSSANTIQTMGVIHVSGINVWVEPFESTPSFFKIYTIENSVEYLTGLLGLRTATKCISLVKFSEQAGEKLRRIRDLYRSLLWTLEQAGGILPENLKVRMWRACGVQSPSDSSDQQRYPHTQLSIVEVPSQKSADIRTHRSQSALLLGEQPCSLLRVAHINLPRRHDLVTSVRTESCIAGCHLRDVIDFSQSASIYNVYMGLESCFGHQSGPLHDIQIQIHPHITEKGGPILALSKPAALPSIQLGPRTFIDPIYTIRPYTLYSSISACTRGGLSFCTDAAEEKLESFVDTGVTSEKKSTKAQDLTTLPQDGLIMQQQKGKRKHAALCSDLAVQPCMKRRRFSKSIPQVSTVSPVLWQFGTSKVLGDCSPSAAVQPSLQEIFQVSISRSPGGFVTASQGNLPTYDGKGSSLESDKPDDGPSGQLVHSSKDLHSQSIKNRCSAGTQSLDSRSRRRIQPLITDGARQIAHCNQAAAEATTWQDGYSALSSVLSFQELLSSVSQNFAISSPSTRSSGEQVLIHPKSCRGGKSSSSGNRKAQGLQSLIDTKRHLCSYGEESSSKQLQDGSLNGEDSRLEDGRGDTHEDLNRSGGISSVHIVPAMNCKSSKSKRMDDTNSRRPVRCRVEYDLSANQVSTNIQADLEQQRNLEEVVNSSPGVQEPVSQGETPLTEDPRGRNYSSQAEIPLLQCAKPYEERQSYNIPTTHKAFHKTRDLMVTNEPDLVEVEVLQSNVLVEQEKTKFQQKLSALLEKPFDAMELEALEKSVSVRKPQMRLRESRQEVRHVPLRKEGLSYLEHYPDFHRKLESTNPPQDKLKLLRGFFFWIQHTCMLGAFMPWEEREEDDDIQILEEKSKMSKRTTAGNSTRTKEVKSQDKQGGATQQTRDPRPRSIMHMSLRARKKVVYKKTSKPKRAKKIANQLATSNVKTERNVDTCPEIRKEKSAVCIATASRRISVNKGGKVNQNDKSGHQQHRKYHK